MNNSEFDRDLEADVRAELRRTVVPPATPEYLRDRIDRMSLVAGSRGNARLDMWHGRRLAVAAGFAAALAVVAFVGSGLFLPGQNLGGGAPASIGATTAAVSPAPSGAIVAPTVFGSPAPFSPAPSGKHQNVDGMGWVGGQTGFVVVGESSLSEALYMTTDGGLSWSEPRPMPQSMGKAPEFVDAQHGFMVATSGDPSETQIIENRTVDGGKTWQSTAVTTLTIQDGTGLAIDDHFSDVSHGVVLVGRVTPSATSATIDNCRLYASNDGGVSWTNGSAAPCISGGGLSWVSSTMGFALVGQTPPTVATTTDGGRTWTTAVLPGVPADTTVVPRLMVQSGGTGQLRFVASYWFNNARGATVAPLAVFQSPDAGASWTEAYQSSGSFWSGNSTGMSAFSAEHWVALSYNGTVGNLAQVVVTRDGGRTWSHIGSDSFQADGVAWSDELHGMILANDCLPGQACNAISETLYVTSDGGLTWHQVPF